MLLMRAAGSVPGMEGAGGIIGNSHIYAAKSQNSAADLYVTLTDHTSAAHSRGAAAQSLSISLLTIVIAFIIVCTRNGGDLEAYASAVFPS